LPYIFTGWVKRRKRVADLAEFMVEHEEVMTPVREIAIDPIVDVLKASRFLWAICLHDVLIYE
jgi:hypothetical protein